MLFSFNDISYSLGIERSRQIKVSGSVDCGGVLVVRGPSGSGKSTLLRILARLRPCEKGEAFLLKKSWLDIPGTCWRRKIHYQPQKPALFDGTVAANLAKPFETRILGGSKPDFRQAKEIMDELGLAPHLWEQDARTLSGGEAARLAFVRAILIDPVVLLLDEPTAGLDHKSRRAFYNVLGRWLAGPDKAALLVSHNNDYECLESVSFINISV